MSDCSNYRTRCYRFLWYPEDETHAKAMESLKNDGYSFVAILHDKDTWLESDDGFNPDIYKVGDLKKSHWHGIIRFQQARYRNKVASDLGIKPNYLQECKDYKNACLYLVHESNPDKFQYDNEELFGDLKSAVISFLSAGDESDRVKTIIDMISGSPGIITYTEILTKVCNNGLYGEFRRMGTLAVALIREHNEEFEKDIELRKRCFYDRERFADFVKDECDRYWVARSKLDKNIRPLDD